MGGGTVRIRLKKMMRSYGGMKMKRAAGKYSNANNEVDEIAKRGGKSWDRR